MKNNSLSSSVAELHNSISELHSSIVGLITSPVFILIIVAIIVFVFIKPDKKSQELSESLTTPGIDTITTRNWKVITGIFELCLGFPVLGGLMIIAMQYTPLFIMFILHLVTLIISANNKVKKYGSIVGMVTCFFAWIPVLGMILHIVTGILLLTSTTKQNVNQVSSPTIVNNYYANNSNDKAV